MTKKQFPTYLLLLFLLTLATSYTLQGKWSLQTISHLQTKVPPKNNIQIQIESFIYRKSQVQNKLRFNTCYPIIIQFEIVDNYIYFNFVSQIINDQVQNTCLDQEFRNIWIIRENLRMVMQFEIRGDTLLLLDSRRIIVFRFSRVMEIRKDHGIVGGWLSTDINGQSIGYPLRINQTAILTCKGATFRYSKDSNPYIIGIQMIDKADCDDQNLIDTLSNVRYFRRDGDVLQMYDQHFNIIISTIEKHELLTLPTPRPPSQKILPPPSKGFQNGQYLLLLLFRRDLPRLIITISQQTIQVKICSTLIFTYTINKQTNQIQILSSSTPDNKCRRVDQNIYAEYLLSAVKYGVDEEGIVKLEDGLGRNVVVFSPR